MQAARGKDFTTIKEKDIEAIANDPHSKIIIPTPAELKLIILFNRIPRSSDGKIIYEAAKDYIMWAKLDIEETLQLVFEMESNFRRAL